MRIMDSMKVKEFLNKIKPLGYSWEYTESLCEFPTNLSILCKGKPDIAVGLDWKNLTDTKKDGDIVTNEEILELDVSWIYIKQKELGIPEFTSFIGENAPGITLYDKPGIYNTSNESQLKYFDKAYQWCLNPFEAKLDIVKGYINECKIFNDKIFPYLKSIGIDKYKQTFLMSRDGCQTSVPFFVVGPHQSYSLYDIIVEYNVWTRHLEINCTNYDKWGNPINEYNMGDICHTDDYKEAIFKYLQITESIESIEDVKHSIESIYPEPIEID